MLLHAERCHTKRGASGMGHMSVEPSKREPCPLLMQREETTREQRGDRDRWRMCSGSHAWPACMQGLRVRGGVGNEVTHETAPIPSACRNQGRKRLAAEHGRTHHCGKPVCCSIKPLAFRPGGVKGMAHQTRPCRGQVHDRGPASRGHPPTQTQCGGSRTQTVSG